jgi:hypothetical protein
MNFRPCFFPAVILLGCCTVAYGQQGPGTSSSKIKQKTEQHVKAQPAGTNDVAAPAYQNAEFGFSYKVPYGWVERTQAMQEEANDPAKSQLLLAVFERPPEVTGDTVNSAVVITAESAASYPGLKVAAEYMGPLTELTTSKGFTVTQRPYEFTIGSTQLVRSDFAKEMSKLTMHQSSLVMLHKGFVVSFTFIGGGEDEVEELMERLSLGAAKAK